MYLLILAFVLFVVLCIILRYLLKRFSWVGLYLAQHKIAVSVFVVIIVIVLGTVLYFYQTRPLEMLHVEFPSGEDVYIYYRFDRSLFLGLDEVGGLIYRVYNDSKVMEGGLTPPDIYDLPIDVSLSHRLVDNDALEVREGKNVWIIYRNGSLKHWWKDNEINNSE